MAKKIEPQLNLQPTVENLTACLDEYGLNLLSFEPAVRGVENTTVFIKTDTAKYVIRIYKRDTYTDSQIQTEIQFMQYLYDKGFLVPRLIPNSRKRSLSHTIIDGTRWQHILMNKVRGEHLKDYTHETVAQLGSAMAHLHLLSTHYPPSRQNQAPQTTFTVYSSAVEQQKLGSEIRKIMAEAEQFKIQLSEAPYGYIHGDITKANTLFDQDKLSAVIDFEAAHLGYFAEDLGVLLWGLLYNIEYKQADRALIKTLLESYSSVRPLSALEQNALSQFIILRSYQLLDLDILVAEPDDDSVAQDLTILERARNFSAADYL